MEIDRSRFQDQASDELGSELVVSSSWYWNYLPQWCPTSMSLLRAAESRILKVIKTPFEAKYVNIGKIFGKEDIRVWTLTLNRDSPNTPLVLLHGFASGVALWCLNFDSFAKSRPVYAIDLPGFARSSRPYFSSNALEAENQIVQCIEEWRKRVGLEKFVLLGHSMGGFIASAYALQHPDPINHLILADPWGFPERPVNNPSSIKIPFFVKAIAYVLQPFNPLWILRLSGPYGPRLVQKARPDIFRKFSTVVDDPNTTIADYVYHCNAQTPTGESFFHALMSNFGWAKFPMIHRISALRSDVPITFIYGARSWIDRHPGEQIKEMRKDSLVDLHIISGAGHHVYADKCDDFHAHVVASCEAADRHAQVELHEEERPTKQEEKMHEEQTELSHTALGVLQATETIETP